MPATEAQARPPRAVVNWLVVIFVMVVAMVVIGGITRLTGSGLSMVEWRPLIGWLPPLDEVEWIEVFESLSDTEEPDGDPQLVMQRQHGSTFGSTVEFGDHQPSHRN